MKKLGRIFQDEAELAQTIRSFLLNDGWEVYQEVPLPGGRADLVGVKGPTRWIIECKMRASFDLFSQACRRVPYAHMVSIATPGGVKGTTQWGLTQALQAIKPGIGWLQANQKWEVYAEATEKYRASDSRWKPPEDYFHHPVTCVCRPGFNRRSILRRGRGLQLLERQKDFAAAGTAGSFWSPFRETVQNLVDYVEDKGGLVELGEALSRISHHYASIPSAKGTISSLIRDGIIDQLKIEKVDRKNFIRLTTAEDEQAK